MRTRDLWLSDEGILCCPSWQATKLLATMAPGITESPDEVPQYEIQDENEGDGENVCPGDQVLPKPCSCTPAAQAH